MLCVDLEALDSLIELINLLNDRFMVSRGKNISKVFFFPVLNVLSHALIDWMIFLDLLVEGQNVFDLYVSESLNQPLVAIIVASDILVYLCLWLLVHLCQKTSNLAPLTVSSIKVLNKASFAGLLDGTRSAVEDVGLAISILCWFVWVIVAQSFLLRLVDLHSLGDILEGEGVLFIQKLHWLRIFEWLYYYR